MSKLLKMIIFYRIEQYIGTEFNEFEYKKHFGTDLCIYTLKEIIKNLVSFS